MKSQIDKDHIKSEEDRTKSSQTLKEQVSLKQKELSDKVEDINKHLAEIKASIEKDHIKNQEDRSKSTQTLKGQIQLKQK